MNQPECRVIGALVVSPDLTKTNLFPVEEYFGLGLVIPSMCAHECEHYESMCLYCIGNWQKDFNIDYAASSIFPKAYPN